MESYLNKVCKAKKPKEVAVNVQHEKKYCSSFIKGKDRYCKNYIGARPFTMSCSSQCCRHDKIKI